MELDRKMRRSGKIPFWAVPPALRGYRIEWLRHDLVAGAALFAILVPAGMAYAQAADLPPVTGLYATVVPLFVYAAVGPSRVLVLGPDSALAPMIVAALVPLAADNEQKWVALAGLLGGFPVSASTSRTPVAVESGAKSHILCREYRQQILTIGQIQELLSAPLKGQEVMS